MPAEAPAPAALAPGATARLFFALWPPAVLAGQLGAVARQAALELGGRATRPETIHLTLAFLGDVAEARLPELCRAAAAIRGKTFGLGIDCLACWPHKHLLWAGCSVPPPALRQLHSSLGEGLAGLGLRPDDSRHTFTPHLSLVRRLPEALALSERSWPLPICRLDWPCQRFVLVRSRLSSVGPDYQILAEFPLAP